MRFIFTASLSLAIMIAVGCGGPASGAEHGRSGDGPPELTSANAAEVERTYWTLDPTSDERIPWRDALIRHRATGSRTGSRTGSVTGTEAILSRGDYAEVIEHFERLTSLLTPGDIEEQRVPAELGPLAEWVINNGSARGDEGSVMASHLLLAAIGEDSAAHRAAREQIARWGREVRARETNPLERYSTLIEVWEQHEDLAPSPEVLRTLARLHVEQRDALNRAFGSEGGGLAGRLSFRQLQVIPQLIQRAPLDVAAVFLRHGDLEHGATEVRRMGEAGGLEWRLADILELGQNNTPEGAAALAELAQGFSRARPEVSRSICHVGVRRFHDDAHFPLCLARVASQSEDPNPAVATAWYAEAVRVAPDDREVYDEALGQLGELMENVLQLDVGQSRTIVNVALTILDARAARWPTASTTVTRDALLLQIGRAEMSAGNLPEARARLTESLAAHETRDGHIELGRLLERIGQPAEAAQHYRRALDMTVQPGAEGVAERAELIEHLADAFRRQGNEQQSQRLYQQALEMWNPMLEELQGPQRSIVEVRRGVLASRLGDSAAAEVAFTSAMQSARDWREPYTAILAHLVVSSPNVELARTVFRRAQFQLTLEREWKVYFALWVQVIAARAEAAPSTQVTSVFRAQSGDAGWSARLAAFGRNELDHDALAAAAQDAGQRCEANFYEGARHLGAGEPQEARRFFELVLESGLVNFYEYAMAQELLTSLPDLTGEVAEQTAN